MTKELENKEWIEFDLKDVFTEIQRGKRLKKADHIEGLQPYVSSTGINNGIDGYVGNKEKVRVFNNCLTLANSGSVGSCFYQPFPFVASDHITKLENKEIGKYTSLFIANLVSRLGVKYSFNREINDKRIKREKIILPTNNKGEPDYEFMEQYMRHKEQEKIEEYQGFVQKRLNDLKKTPKTISINEKEWGEFFIQDIAEILSGKDIYAKERIEGNTPYVSATANQNGIGYFVDNENKTLESNCLSVNRNGSVGYSFYHPYKALFGNDCRKLRLKKSNKHIGIFVAQQITRQKGKYGYGYKMGTARLKRQKIMLPINENNEPDYVFMENYMRNLEYKKLSEYLEFKKK
jgi:hypothetical protein